MKNFTFIYLVTLLFLTACQKDEDVFVVEDVTVSSLQVGVIGGLLTDVDGNTISNTSVSLKTQDATYETETDNNGVFYFTNPELKEERTYLSVSSEGYFPGSRVFIPKKGNAEFIHISLMPMVTTYTFEAIEGGSFDLPGEGELIFAPNAISDVNGNPYSGMVNIANRFLPSTHIDMGTLMPGDLVALDAEGMWQSLATYGIMAFQLTDDSGEILNITSADLVTLKIIIDESQMNTAPSAINLWSFDLQSGYWTTKGTAQRVGDYYETPVTDFTYLNWAVPYPMINLSSKVQLSTNSAAYANSMVEVTVVGSGVCAYGVTDDAGYLETGVAANQVLSIKVLGHCGEEVYEGEIGPFSVDSEVGPVNVFSPNSTVIEIKGDLLDCDGNEVWKGYVNVTIGDEDYLLFTANDGTFGAYLDACGNQTFSIKGVDVYGESESELLNFQISEWISAGSISTCN